MQYRVQYGACRGDETVYMYASDAYACKGVEVQILSAALEGMVGMVFEPFSLKSSKAVEFSFLISKILALERFDSSPLVIEVYQSY